MAHSDSLLTALAGITGTGAFHSSGTFPFFFPKLQVKGLGELSFPVSPSQAKELIGLADAAPYGQGEKTVHDDSVRKCWQIDAADFSCKSPQWKGFLAAVVECIREDMGIMGKVSARPYKLLVYGKGGHFKAHRDSEKLDAMFGTLIIALPSAHQGGQLLVRHDGREIAVDFSMEKHLHEFQYAAFFADCEHEVTPVRSGYRCCLVYNLRLVEGNPAQLNLSLNHQSRSLLPSLTEIKNRPAGDLRAVLLEHGYTKANMSLKNLKGNDVARAQALFAAAKEAGFVAHLALVTLHRMGALEDDYDYGRSRHRGYDEDDDPEDGTMGEIYDEDLTLSDWRNSRDRRVDFGSYGIGPDAIISNEKIDAGDPDEIEAEGYTGNAGCTMDHWYRRAAIVLWAEEDHERILCRYDFRCACATLAGLAKEKKPASAAAFKRLGEAVIARFPDALPPPRHLSPDSDHSTGPFVITLLALAGAGARDLLESLLARVPADAFLQCDAALWKKLHKSFGVEVFAPVYDNLLASDAANSRPTLFQILDGLLACKGGADRAATIAARLARLAPKPPRPSNCGTAKREPDPPGDRQETRILLAASHLLVKPADRRAALAFILADNTLAHTREILGPVLLDRSAKKPLSRENSLAPDALASARSLLAAEVARPLRPYPDWTRPSPPAEQAKPVPGSYYQHTSPKSTQALGELATFMADPAAKTHEFRYAQDVRIALETIIRDRFLDLDHITIRKGTPHTLACTKNDKSYQHSLAVRAKDETLLAKLKEI